MDYIPVDKEDIPEQFEIDLADDTFILQFNYNETGDFYTVDLLDFDQEPIVLGEKLILNQPLWNDIVDDRLPAPSLVPMDESGNADRVSFDNFMETVFLYIDDISPDEGEGMDE